MASQPERFWTGMVTHGEEQYQPEAPFKGAGWTALLEAPWPRTSTIMGGREIVLVARSLETAQRTLNLIHSCHSLVQGAPDLFTVQPLAFNGSQPGDLSKEERTAVERYMYSASNFPLACAVAAKASRRRSTVYAVAKYAFSLATFSIQSVDLEPWHAPHLAISSFPDDHVMFAHAIIAAYSVVEDLGLNLRASAKNPSRIDGEWNPAVRSDLEARLRASDVVLDKKLLWTVRGPRRRIEKKRPLPDGEAAPWAGQLVRDSDIPIVDAIAYAEWLRSAVAAHGVKDLTPSLSPYDVINVQHVARRLLLETLGFWRWWEEHAPTRDAESLRINEMLLGDSD
jgi:hypothetical protein